MTPDESGGFIATIQEFPGLIAEGDTAEEALRNLEKAAESWLEVAISHGQEIREPIDFEGSSGKIALRIPRGLHKQVAELAELEDCSINQFLTAAIADYVSRTDVLKKISNVLQTSMPPLVHFDVVAMSQWHLRSSHDGVTVIPQKDKLFIKATTPFDTPAVKEVNYG